MSLSVKNIIPSYDWFAIYEDKEGSAYRVALICFALNEDGTIVGFVPDEGEIVPANKYKPEDKYLFARYELLKEEFDIEFTEPRDLN